MMMMMMMMTLISDVVDRHPGVTVFLLLCIVQLTSPERGTSCHHSPLTTFSFINIIIIIIIIIIVVVVVVVTG